MGAKYEITYQKVKVISSIHIKEIQKVNPQFSCYNSYWVKYQLGRERGILLCDGKHIMRAPLSGFDVIKTQEIEPSANVRHLINKELFNI
jgi:hypothetical protein